MNKKMLLTNGLSEKDNDLESSIQSFLYDRKAQNLSKGTLHFYQVKTESFLSFCKENKASKITDITPELIRKFLLQLQDSNHTEGGIHAFYRVIRTFLYFWEEEFEPENYKNPIRKVKAPKVSTEPIEGISKETVYRLLEVCRKRNFYGERDRAILLILLETGVRATELCNLNYEDYDSTDNSFLVRQGKGRKPRSVFIGRTARKQLRVYLKYRGYENGPLFTSKAGDRLKYFSLRQIIRRLAEKIGIPEPGLHDFRRTFALESLRNGVDIQSLSRIMGHSDLQILSRYLKQNKGDLADSYKSIVDNDI